MKYESPQTPICSGVDKELNLCELLKVGDTVYSPTFGERTVNSIMSDRLCDSTFICYKNGKIWDKGECIIYPSRTLYEKYPLDPYSAWMEWKAQRELEFNKPECYITDVNKWWELKVVAKFHSSKEAKQAAEAVRECLEKFHQSVAQSK